MRNGAVVSKLGTVTDRMRMVILSLSILGIALVNSACTSSANPTDPLKNHPIHGPIPSLKHYYTEALAEARTWHDDALVIWAEVNVMNGHSKVFYRFKSESFPGERYLVQLEITSSGTEMTIFEGSFEGPGPIDPVISLEESILDSPDVADLAISHGGREFITNYPDAVDLIIQLRGVSGAAAEELGIEAMRISWRVGISRLPLYSMDLTFDPLTGEFLGSIIRE